MSCRSTHHHRNPRSQRTGRACLHAPRPFLASYSLEQDALGSIETRVQFGIFDRPHYALGVYSAANLAKRLGWDSIQLIEFEVAGGRDVLALERLAKVIGDDLHVKIQVAGFDTGGGMPAPVNYRDLPHVWDQGFYVMDVPKLKSRLAPSTELVLGNVRTSVETGSVTTPPSLSSPPDAARVLCPSRVPQRSKTARLRIMRRCPSDGDQFRLRRAHRHSDGPGAIPVSASAPSRV